MALDFANIAGFIGLTVQGDLAGFTFYTSKRRQRVFYPQAPPLDPPSWAQSYQRLHFQAAAQAWRGLTQQQKNDYQASAIAVHARITGYNLWLQAALKNDDTNLVAIEKKTGVPLARPWV